MRDEMTVHAVFFQYSLMYNKTVQIGTINSIVTTRLIDIIDLQLFLSCKSQGE